MYSPTRSWQSSKTNQAHCPVQDVTIKGLPSTKAWFVAIQLLENSWQNSIWGTHENKQKEFLIDYLNILPTN